MKEQIAALAVLADPNASPDDKAAALKTLSAYFDAQLDAEESAPPPAPEGTSETKDDGENPPTEKTSEGGEDPKDEQSAEMTSALATIDALTARVAKLEKASAVGLRPRASKSLPIPRVLTAPINPHDAVAISMIEKAGANTIRMLGKK